MTLLLVEYLSSTTQNVIKCVKYQRGTQTLNNIDWFLELGELGFRTVQDVSRLRTMWLHILTTTTIRRKTKMILPKHYIVIGFGSNPSDFRSVLKEIIQHIAYLDDNWSGIISKSLIIVCT